MLCIVCECFRLALSVCVFSQVESEAGVGCFVGAEGWTVVALGECVEAGEENPGALGVAEGEWTEEDSEEEAVEDRRWTVERGEGWGPERWI